jgi:hypothetical protein
LSTENYTGRNKALEEHIKDTPNAGPHQDPSRSSKRMEERQQLDEIRQAINNGEDIDRVYYND